MRLDLLSVSLSQRGKIYILSVYVLELNRTFNAFMYTVKLYVWYVFLKLHLTPQSGRVLLSSNTPQ